MVDVNAEAVRLVEIHGGLRAAARASGIPETTIRNRYRVGLADRNAPTESESEIEYPDLPSSELEPHEIVDHACKEFARSLAARDARRWFEIKIKSNQPIGVVFMGDPHIDNSGTNWPLLREHIKLLETTPGLYAIGGNDVTDNWIGRLVRLYADSKMSKKQAWKLTKWLMKESKVKWLCHVLGNHDAWGDGPHLLKANAQPFVPVEDWQARFQIVFPNDTRVRVHMAHDFPGTSQWNHLHGAQKMALWGEQADIYACAHKHCWAIHEEENAHRGFTYWLLRARGYKFIDSYADVHGYGSQRHGASITAIIDPMAEGPSRVRCFPDVAEAVEFLTWKRNK
jgi:hypothetical protein